MALITISGTAPAPSPDIPSATHRIGQDLAHWWTSVREAVAEPEGEAPILRARIGASDAVWTDRTGLAWGMVKNREHVLYRRTQGTSARHFIAPVARAGNVLTIISSQQIIDNGSPPWGLVLGAPEAAGLDALSSLSAHPYRQPGNSMYFQAVRAGSAVVNEVYGARPAANVPVHSVIDLTSWDVTMWAGKQTPVTRSFAVAMQGATVPDLLSLRIGAATGAFGSGGHVPEIMLYWGDLRQNPDLAGRIAGYFADIYGV